MTPPIAREHAVVLGSGMAGLFAARVLSSSYDAVTVVERDDLPRTPLHRKGIPQGRHLHRLLSRGSQLVDEMFPGILTDMVESGATVDDGDPSRRYVRIGDFALPRSGRFRDPAALVTYSTSRPFLEWHVRRRVRELGNVVILDGHDIGELIAAPPERIAGVWVTCRHTRERRMVAGDLVVDATGRATRTPQYLENLGYGRAPVQHCGAAATYASQFFRMPTTSIGERLMMVQPHPKNPGGLLAAAERDTWVLSIGQLSGDWVAPANSTELLTIAEGFTPEPIMEALRRAEPMGEVAVFRHRDSIWRRYDQMPRFPEGLLVIGDALCSLNPIYGQGMTVAAQQAVALRDHLCTAEDDLGPQRFFSAVARCIGPTWAANQMRDTPPPSTDRRRSPAARFTRWILSQALEAARDDVAFAEVFLRVNNLVDPPSRLRDPLLIGRMIAANTWRRISRHAVNRTGRVSGPRIAGVSRQLGALANTGRRCRMWRSAVVISRRANAAPRQ